jgi:curved DNA-binding protein CbpA
LNFYDMLDVPPDADHETLKRAIAHQSAQWSKRVSMAASVEKRREAEDALQRIGEARQTLLDDVARRAYDRSLQAAHSPGFPMSAGANRPDTSSSANAKRRPCPVCGEEIALEAKKCRFCNEWLDDAAATSPAGTRSRFGSASTESSRGHFSPDAPEGAADRYGIVPPDSRNDQVPLRPTPEPSNNGGPPTIAIAVLIGLMLAGVGIYTFGREKPVPKPRPMAQASTLPTATPLATPQPASPSPSPSPSSLDSPSPAGATPTPMAEASSSPPPTPSSAARGLDAAPDAAGATALAEAWRQAWESRDAGTMENLAVSGFRGGDGRLGASFFDKKREEFALTETHSIRFDNLATSLTPGGEPGRAIDVIYRLVYDSTYTAAFIEAHPKSARGFHNTVKTRLTLVYFDEAHHWQAMLDGAPIEGRPVQGWQVVRERFL